MSLPNPHYSLHFPQGPKRLLEDLSAQGPLRVHLPNRTASLEAIVELGAAVDDEEEGSLYFPESGLNLRTALLQATHASATSHGHDLALELDFMEAPRGLGFSSVSDEASFRNILLHHAYTVVARHDLDRQRQINTPAECICPRCAAVAKARRESPEKHPLTSIARHAVHTQLPLFCRIDATHAGLSCWLKPERVQTRQGIISISDDTGHTTANINLGFAHSMWVQKSKIDGEPYAMLRIFDNLGNLGLEIATPDPKIAWVWEQICEATEPFADEI